MTAVPSGSTDLVSVLSAPIVRFGREICDDLEIALRREWLVTNGIGGYASSTITGSNTRTYHGLLVAALEPPVARTVLVGGTIETAVYDGRRYLLSVHEYGDSHFDPRGERQLESFTLDGMLPIWRYAAGDALIERRVWMARGANTTYLAFRVIRASRPVELSVTPLVSYRDFHTVASGAGWQMQVDAEKSSATDQAFAGATPMRMLADGGEFVPGGDWYWNFRLREESARGLPDHGDLYAPGAFRARLDVNQQLTLVFTAEDDADQDGERSLAAAQERQLALLDRAGVAGGSCLVQQLVLAADQFLVARADLHARTGASGGATSIIAGYHWFNDWGRDTMIALRGLTLATRRPDETAAILRNYAAFLKDGLLPNNFPDRADVEPAYNTADAPLWFIIGVDAYRRATGDDRAAAAFTPNLVDIIEHYLAGTRFGIGVDPADGLVHAGEAGLQVTWMDAKVDDWVVTPRIGKPVELQALWINALHIAADAVARNEPDRAKRYRASAEQARHSFLARFTNGDREHLADLVDGPSGDDWSLRPNQIFALSLPIALLDREPARKVLTAIGRALLTSYGLRSLSPKDSAYRGSCTGDRRSRDSAYHQGTAWAWLLGPYIEAIARFENVEQAKQLLLPLVDHLRDAGLGTISEIFDGDPPHTPRGAIAQAWSVAEILRVARDLEAAT